ncbi:sulfotransferase family protein [Roseovarius phycicola]|uniref:Sulfotransferase family protein n=1 Tax=Roseovarius phycicola TaxID=3080976 RepID=A0ABZ2HE75_9RHOB
MTGHPIYFLWATPRSTSTAFEWMMRQRGDLSCFHEPFGMAWYQGPEARAPRVAPTDRQRPEATFEKIWIDIQEAAEKRPVFVKDMPHHTDHLWSDAFLERITHSFLIRDPAKVLASLHCSYKKAGMEDGFEAQEISFGPQQALFDLLRALGQTPPVLDSDDLLEDPDTMVRIYCKAIGIPFIRAALSWEPGARDDVLWYDGNDEIWHASLRDSDGLKPIPRKHVDPDDLPENLNLHYETFMRHYNSLYTHRLRPEMVSG